MKIIFIARHKTKILSLYLAKRIIALSSKITRKKCRKISTEGVISLRTEQNMTRKRERNKGRRNGRFSTKVRTRNLLKDAMLSKNALKMAGGEARGAARSLL